MSRLFGEAKVAPIGATQARQLVQVLSAPGRAPSSSDYLTQIIADARYAAIGHTHSIAQVTGLQTTLDGKQAASQNLTDWDDLIDVIGNGAGGYIQRVNGGWFVVPNVPTTDLTGTLQAAQFPALTGDVTTAAGSLATTLATVIAAGGPVGNSSTVPVITYDSKGRLVAVSSQAITPAAIGALPASGGSTNRIAKWTSASALGAGIITDDGDFVFADPGSASGGRFKSRYAGAKAQLVGNANSPGWWGIGTDGTASQVARIGRTDSDGVFVSGAFEFSVLGNLRLPGCLFRDDVWSSDGYAIYASGVTPNNTNASLYLSKNGALTAINGSGSSSLSVDGVAVATAYASGLSIPSLAAGGMLRAAAGGLLQIAAASDLPGGPYLPLSAGSSKPITGILSLQNNLEIMDGKSITSLGATVLTIGTPWYGPGILFPWTASTISGIDFQVDGRSKFVGLLNPAGGIAGDISGGDAPSQGVGEYITSALSNTETVSITATSIFDMTTIELPAGDWDVFATIISKANIAAAARFRAAISTSTATIASDGREGESSPPTGSSVYTTLTMHKRIPTSASMTVYLSAQFICSSFGAASCWGNLSARRRR